LARPFKKVIIVAIIIRISRQEIDLKNVLEKEHGLQVRTGVNGFFICLPQNNIPHKILQILSDKEKLILLELYEYNGSDFSQVVCGLKGQPLTPFYIKGNRASFSTTKSLVTITYQTEGKEQEIQIERHILEINEDNVYVKQQKIYIGSPPPPYPLRNFDFAAKAAITKFLQYELKKPCYIAHN
jgi:hypothetical protein